MRVDGVNSVLSSVPYVQLQPVRPVGRESGEQYVQVRKEKLVVIDTISRAELPHFTAHSRPIQSTLNASEKAEIMRLIERQMKRLDYLADFPGLYKV